MKLLVKVDLRYDVRCGVEARSPELCLTSHGLDKQKALDSLKLGVLAWCEGLKSLGRLEQVLKQKQLNWQDNGSSIIVELQTATI